MGNYLTVHPNSVGEGSERWQKLLQIKLGQPCTIVGRGEEARATMVASMVDFHLKALGHIQKDRYLLEVT